MRNFFRSVKTAFTSFGKRAADTFRSFGRGVTKVSGAIATLGLDASAPISPDTQQWAAFAAQAYRDPDDREPTLSIPGAGSAAYNAEYSDPTTATYVDTSHRRVVVALRGTASAEDVVTDVDVVSGDLRNTPRYQQDRQLLQRVQGEFPGFEITVVGHSLGGSLALEAAREFPRLKAVVFNPGTSITTPSAGSNSQVHVIKGDPISALAAHRHSGITRVYDLGHTSPLEAHGLKNFTQPNKLN